MTRYEISIVLVLLQIGLILLQIFTFFNVHIRKASLVDTNAAQKDNVPWHQSNTNLSSLVGKINDLEQHILDMKLIHSNLTSFHISPHAPLISGPVNNNLSPSIVNDEFLLANRLNCLDDSKCVIIRHINFGRSGNRLMQLRLVEKILSQCSGASISPKEVTDDVVHFPSMQIFGHPSCSPIWDQIDDIDHVFGQLHSKCQVLDFSWNWLHEKIRCEVMSPPPFKRVHVDSRFPSWLEISMDAWTMPLSSTTAVMHFRGHDIFSANTHELYTQPVCDHYIQSFRHSGATCALLVSEDDANPCVAVVEANLSCTHRPVQCGPACAFTLLARARIAMASFSTFFNTSIEVFDSPERRVYFGYCSNCPERFGQSTRYCTETDKSELFPWSASARQLDLLRTRPASVIVC
jgi:hypothetical protein